MKIPSINLKRTLDVIMKYTFRRIKELGEKDSQALREILLLLGRQEIYLIHPKFQLNHLCKVILQSLNNVRLCRRLNYCRFDRG